MSVVDVDKMIREKTSSEKKEKIKENQEIKRETQPKKRAKFVMRKPTMRTTQIPREHIMNLLNQQNEDTEIKSGIKDGIFNVLSLPIKPDKREKLHNNLQSSTFLNRYIDNNVYLSYFNHMNDDLKAMACYGFHYIDAMKN